MMLPVRNDRLLRQQVFFQAGNLWRLAAVIDPQQLGVAARAGVELVFVPEVGGRVRV